MRRTRPEIGRAVCGMLVAIFCCAEAGAQEEQPAEDVKQARLQQDQRPAFDHRIVRGMVESGIGSTVKQLRDCFASHSSATAKRVGRTDPYYDAEILLALGDPPVDLFHVAFRQTLRDVWQRGPMTGVSASHDESYMASMSSGIRLLGVSSSEPDMELLAELAGDESLSLGLRSQAYYWCLVHSMRQEGILEAREAAEWAYKRHILEGGRAIPAYKGMAVERIIYAYGQGMLPHLRQLKESVAESEGEKSPGVRWLTRIACNLASRRDQEMSVAEALGRPYWRPVSEAVPARVSPTDKRPAGVD